MDKGTNPSRSNLRRMSLLALLIMTVALPATSMNSPSMNRGAAADPPAPSSAQRALIEAHDTTGVGWWSSPAMDIAPGPDAAQPAASPDPLMPAPGNAYPQLTPGVESR